MKKSTIARLSVLMFMLVSATAWAGNDASAGHGTAPFVRDPEMILDVSGQRTMPGFEADAGANVTVNDGYLESESVPVLAYPIGKQVTIDLEYRPFDADEDVQFVFSDQSGVKSFAQNLMLGFSYKF